MQAHADNVLRLLDARRESLPEPARTLAAEVIDARDALAARAGRVAGLGQAGQRIRVHGDYHLGQVLRTEEDFVILDFEGEPARTLEERRAKQSPLKDVAGMIRSFSYAAYAALFASTVHAPDQYPALAGWADTWQYWAADAFLSGYRAASAGAAFAAEGEGFEVLLEAFVLEKALYELAYELNNRPDWVRIPLVGIRQLI
jgi:maltose alpha-D-glucosyltransferase/alpha-amylase